MSLHVNGTKGSSSTGNVVTSGGGGSHNRKRLRTGQSSCSSSAQAGSNNEHPSKRTKISYKGKCFKCEAAGHSVSHCPQASDAEKSMTPKQWIDKLGLKQ